MLLITASTKLFLYPHPIDLRKGFEGLCGVVESFFNRDIIDGAHFIFLNRTQDRLKVIYWDGDGLAIWYKRLERGSFQRIQQEGNILDRKLWLMLLEGVEPKRFRIRYKGT